MALSGPSVQRLDAKCDRRRAERWTKLRIAAGPRRLAVLSSRGRSPRSGRRRITGGWGAAGTFVGGIREAAERPVVGRAPGNPCRRRYTKAPARRWGVEASRPGAL